MTTSITSNDLYQRQITLIGKDAFDKMRKAKVLIVGAGGLGCPALQYLAASGIGEIGIVDFDTVSASNLQRQILFQANDIGRKKTEVARERLKLLAPFCEIQVHAVRLDESNAETIISTYDVILDCTDNFSTKFLIHDSCLKTQKVLIQASVYQYEGQLQLFDFSRGEGPCLRCLWPVEPQDGCTGTCEQVGVMGPLLGVLGSMQAMEAIKFLIDKEHLKNGETLFVDLMGLSFDVRRFQQVKDCPYCVKKEFSKNKIMQIGLPSELNQYVILDVRSSSESAVCSFVQKIKKTQEIVQIPLDQISEFKPLQGQKYLAVCTRGIRSLSASKLLTKNNVEVYSLAGGIEALTVKERT